MPRVSIGLPVYNGENYLREALDSILSQSFKDFELIISNNASTDGTADICKAYAAKDRRIRYFRNQTNLGAAKNFNRVFELSTGEYFKWAAHDDILTPDFLLKCVQRLDHDPAVILCYSKTKIIDARGLFLFDDDTKLDIDLTRPASRFGDLVLIVHPCFPVFGVIRAEILRKTPLIGGYTSSDRVLLGELSLHGRFFEIPEYLFFRRNHPRQSIMAFNYRERIIWFDPLKAGKIVFIVWRVFLEYCLAIKRAPLSWRDRWSCCLVMAKWFKMWWKGLAFDLLAAAKQIVLRPRPVFALQESGKN